MPSAFYLVMRSGFALPTDYGINAAEPSQVWIPLQIDPADDILVKINTAAEQGQRGEKPNLPPLPRP